jgi:multidrug resistance efflux pump
MIIPRSNSEIANIFERAFAPLPCQAVFSDCGQKLDVVVRSPNNQLVYWRSSLPAELVRDDGRLALILEQARDAVERRGVTREMSLVEHNAETIERPKVSVVREPNFKRRYHRVTVPLFVALEGRTYQAADWSLGGLRLTGYRGSVAVGDEVDATLVLPYSGFNVTLPIRLRAVRRTAQDMGCQFVDPEEQTRRALRHLLEAALEGRGAAVSDALAVLNAPISSAPLEDLLLEEDDTHFHIGSTQLMRKTTVYLGAGVLALTLVAGLVYRNLAYLDAPEATVMGNFVSIASRADGRLADVLVDEGQEVQTGDVLFEIDNQDLVAAVDLAEARLATVRAEHAAVLGVLAEEQDRHDLFRSVSREQANRARANLRRVEASLAQAEIEQARRQRLVDLGVFPREEADVALEQTRVLREEREALVNELSIAQINESATEEGRFFGGHEIEGRTVELEQKVLVAQAAIGMAESDLRAAVGRLAELRITAPVDGRIYTVYRHVGEVLRPRDVVLSVRANGEYFVVGRLRVDEAVKVRPGMVANVSVPSYDVRFDGLITAVGHQGLSTASQSSADMESSLKEVPIKVLVPDAPLGIPPGVRAHLRIPLRLDWLGWLGRHSDDAPPDLGPGPALNASEEPAMPTQAADLGSG